jgi:hypothetical protein
MVLGLRDRWIVTFGERTRRHQGGAWPIRSRMHVGIVFLLLQFILVNEEIVKQTKAVSFNALLLACLLTLYWQAYASIGCGLR